MDLKENGDGWDVQEEWAPIEDFEQLSFSKTTVSSRTKESLSIVKDTTMVSSSKNVIATVSFFSYDEQQSSMI